MQLGRVIEVRFCVLARHVRYWTGNVSETLPETAVEVVRTEKHIHMRQIPWEWEHFEGFYRRFSDTKLTWGSELPQVVHFRLKEAAVLELEGDNGTPRKAANCIQVRYVFFVCTGEQNLVIETDEKDVLLDSGENNIQRTLANG